MLRTLIADARGASALATGILCALAASAPAVGGAIGNDIGQSEPADVGEARPGGVQSGYTNPDALRRHFGVRTAPPPATPGTAAEPTTVVVDDGLEYGQIGWGALAGAAVASGSVVLVKRRRATQPA